MGATTPAPGMVAAATAAASVPASAAVTVPSPMLRPSVAFPQALKDDEGNSITLAAAPKGGLNVHPSRLPRHRGPVPRDLYVPAVY